MKDNKLTIKISKPVKEVFSFTITPPNSTLWIDSVIHEETNEWPVRKGTVYKLQDKDGQFTEVTVTTIKENNFIEWISKDQNYHCRYSFKPIGKNSTILNYHEWVEKGQIKEPFTKKLLEQLKTVIENEDQLSGIVK